VGTTGSTGAQTSTPTEAGTETTAVPTSDTGVTGETTGVTSDVTTGPGTGTTGDPTGDPTTMDVSTGETTGTSTGAVGECEPGAMEGCYTGPPETDMVGACAPGERVCEARGVWGPCAGEVLPAAESCETPGDEDCDGVDACAGEGEYLWHRTFGAAGEESGMRVAIDGAGNVVLAAQGTSTIDLGGEPLVSAGSYDLFIGRFAPDGAHLWSAVFGDGTNQFNDGFALAVDAAGDIAVAGDFDGQIDFGGGPLFAASMGDPFLARLDPDGNHVWSLAFPAGGYAYPQALAFDAAGELVMGGFFLDTLDLGGGQLTSAGMVDAFLGKFTAGGNHVWSQRFGDAQGQFILGVAADAASNVYVAGGFTGTINLGKGGMVSAGGTDVFVARFDPQGTALWSKRFGDAAPQVARDLAIDGKGRLALGGEMQGTIDLGGGPIGDAGSHSFVAQLDDAGGHLWSHLVSTGQANLRALAYDGPGALLVTGDFSGSGDFGGGALVSEGSSDIFVVKLAPGGQHVWSQRFGDFTSQIGHDVAGAPAGASVVTGSFVGGVNFGGGPANSKGGRDGFIAGFGP
jgi:hypothetical protein